MVLSAIPDALVMREGCGRCREEEGSLVFGSSGIAEEKYKEAKERTVTQTHQMG
jgi:hypothetical protein